VPPRPLRCSLRAWPLPPEAETRNGPSGATSASRPSRASPRKHEPGARWLPRHGRRIERGVNTLPLRPQPPRDDARGTTSRAPRPVDSQITLPPPATWWARGRPPADMDGASIHNPAPPVPGRADPGVNLAELAALAPGRAYGEPPAHRHRARRPRDGHREAASLDARPGSPWSQALMTSRSRGARYVYHGPAGRAAGSSRGSPRELTTSAMLTVYAYERGLGPLPRFASPRGRAGSGPVERRRRAPRAPTRRARGASSADRGAGARGRDPAPGAADRGPLPVEVHRDAPRRRRRD
jgi:hypothetical protein